MFSIFYLNVLDTIVISPRMSGVNNDFSEYQQRRVTVSVSSCCLWDCVWLGLSGEFFRLYFSVFWKVHGIFYVSFPGHNGFMPLPPEAE